MPRVKWQRSLGVRHGQSQGLPALGGHSGNSPHKDETKKAEPKSAARKAPSAPSATEMYTTAKQAAPSASRVSGCWVKAMPERVGQMAWSVCAPAAA